MASVLKLTETFGRTYSSQITGDVTATKVFCVIFDSRIQSMDEVVETAIAGGLPALGSVYNSASGYSTSLIAYSHTPIEINKEQAYYNIQVNYQTNRNSFGLPTNRPWTISFSSIKEQYVPEKTLANAGAATGLPASVNPVGINEPIANTAGQPFDPTVVDVETKIIISLKKNFLSVTDIGSIADIEDLMGRVNTVNDDVSVKIAGITGTPLQFLIDEINLTNVDADGQQYYEVDFRIIYDPKYHVQKILNAGWNQQKNGALIEIKNKNGGDINNPWLLDVNGLALSPNLTPAQRAAQAIYQGFAVKPLSTFADLGLPEDFGLQNDLPVT